MQKVALESVQAQESHLNQGRVQVNEYSHRSRIIVQLRVEGSHIRTKDLPVKETTQYIITS